jgi:hypothetical protein
MATILELDIDTSGISEKTSQLSKDLTDARNKLNEMKKAGQEGSAAYEQQKSAVANLSKEYRQSSKMLSDYIAVEASGIKSVKDARTALSAVSAEWAKEAAAYGENSERAQQLMQTKLALTERLKDLEKQTGDTRRNVGNYTEAVGETIINNNVLTTTIQNLSQTFPIAGKMADGLNKALWKIVMNPIGLIVAGIVLAITGLIKLFSQSKEGGEVFTKVIDKITAALEFAIGVIRNFANILGKVFSGEAKLSDLGKAFEGMGEKFKKAMEQAERISDLKIAIEGLTISLQKSNAELDVQIESLQRLADDSTKSYSTRKKAEEDLAVVQKKRAEQNLDLANQEYELAQLQLQQSIDNGKKDDDLIKAEADAYVKRINAEKELITIAEESDQKLRQMQQERLAKSIDILGENMDINIGNNKKIIDSDRETYEKRLEMLNRLSASTQEGFNKQIKSLENYIGKNINASQLLSIESATLLENKVKELNVSEQVEESILKAINTRKKALSDLNESYDNLSKSQIEQAKKLAEQQIAAQKMNLDNQMKLIKEGSEVELQMRKDILQKEYEMELQQAILINADTELLKQAHLQEMADMDAAYSLNKKEQQLKDLEEQHQIDLFNNEVRYNDEVAYLEKEKQARLLIAQQTGENTELIEAEYSARQKQLKVDEMNFRMELASGLMNNLAVLFEGNHKANQAFQAAQTVIDGIKGSISAYSAMSAIPVVGPALGAVAAAAVLTATGRAVKKIYSTKKGSTSASYSLGGSSSSATTTDGGETASQASNGEATAQIIKNAMSAALKENPSVLVIEEVEGKITQRQVIVNSSEI